MFRAGLRREVGRSSGTPAGVSSRLEAVLLAGDSAGLDAVLADRRCTALADLVRSRATARLEIREPNRDALVDLVTRYNAALVELNQYA